MLFITVGLNCGPALTLVIIFTTVSIIYYRIYIDPYNFVPKLTYA